MAAYLCPECDESYPKHTDYDDCPVCGTSTQFKASLKPDVTDIEGSRRVQRRENQAAFKKWCEENDRTEDDDPPRGELMLPRNHTFRDLLMAQAVRDGLNEEFPGHTVGELHVFKVGL